MKKTKIVSLASIALLLASCGKTSSSNNPTTSSTGDTSEITTTTTTTTSSEPVKSEILSFSVNESYKAYKNSVILDDVENIKKDGGDASKYAHTSFFKNNEGGKDTYKVGSANAFQLHCFGSYLDEDLNLNNEEITDVTHKLEMKQEDGSYLDITSEEGTYVAVTGNNYDFTDAAVGHQFKLTLAPDTNVYAESDFVDDMEFEVINAWNVYTVEDLAYVDNVDPSRELPSKDANKGLLVTDIWEGKRDLSIANSLKGVVLQNNITITTEDIPDQIKFTQKDVDDYVANNKSDFETWSKNKFKSYSENGEDKTRSDEECYAIGKETLLDSLKDFTNIFSRITDEDGEFTIEGNYLTLDVSQVKKVVKFRDKTLTNAASSNGSHSNLFGFPGDGGLGYADDAGVVSPYQFRNTDGHITMNNMNIKGNAPKADNTANLGGLITVKHMARDFQATNVNSSDTFITFFSRVGDDEHTQSSTKIDRCRWYNSYSSMLFFLSTIDNKISNSIMSGAGGSLMLLSESWASYKKDDDRHSGASADIENSYLESWVNGQESWFADKNATTYVPMLAQYQNKILNTLKADYNGTSGYVKVDNGTAYVNLISISLDADNPFSNTLASGNPLKGHVNIDNIPALDFADIAPSATAPLYPYVVAAKALNNQGLLFKSSVGGTAMAGATDGSQLLGYSTAFAQLDSEHRTQAVNQFASMDATLGVLAQNNLFPASQHATITGALRQGGLTTVADDIDSNWTKLVSGDYLALMLQPDMTTNYIGLTLGYNG